MRKLIPEADYLKTHARKRMGVGVLFFDESGKLLIVKPNYKEGWSVTGGVIDADESPKAAAIRETKEEIGLDISDIQFLLVEYVAGAGESIEGLEFMFYGGVLTADQVSKIVIQEEEFDGFQFTDVDTALPLLRPSIKRRTTAALAVIKSGIPTYTEFRS